MTVFRQSSERAVMLAAGKLIGRLIEHRRHSVQRNPVGESGATSVNMKWLAKEAGMSSATLSRILAGNTPASVINLMRIAHAFELSFTEIAQMLEKTVDAAERRVRTSTSFGSAQPAVDGTIRKASVLGEALESPDWSVVTDSIINLSAALASSPKRSVFNNG